MCLSLLCPPRCCLRLLQARLASRPRGCVVGEGVFTVCCSPPQPLFSTISHFFTKSKIALILKGLIHRGWGEVFHRATKFRLEWPKTNFQIHLCPFFGHLRAGKTQTARDSPTTDTDASCAKRRRTHSKIFTCHRQGCTGSLGDPHCGDTPPKTSLASRTCSAMDI